MPDLASQLEHLAEVDGLLATAHARLAEVKDRIARSAELGLPPYKSAPLLEAMEGNLRAMQGQRAVIVRTIEAIRAWRT